VSNRNSITQKELKELLHYDPDTGIFTRKVQAGPHPVGSVAGRKDSIGYSQIGVSGRRYMTHRLAWLYVYGEFPNGEIDHINRDKSDNGIANLRVVNRSQNLQNLGRIASNTSGLKGVSWCNRERKWFAQIMKNKKNNFLGYFVDKEKAHQAYLEAKKRYHEF
jgi:hypothetical protein